MHNYVSIKPLNAILPAGSITHVVAFFESTSSHSVVEDWHVELKVRSSAKIRQIARVFLDAASAEILSVNGIEVRQIKSEPETPVVAEIEEDEEEEKPAKRGRKKKVVEEVAEEESMAAFEMPPLNFIDIPILEIVLNDRLYPLLQDDAFLSLCADEEVKQKLLKSIRLHEKNIIELGEPAPLPSVDEDELEDSLTSIPSLTNDMMTANHQAFRAAQEEIRAKVSKRYEILNKRIQRDEVTPIDERDVVALCEENQIEYKSGDFMKEINRTITGFDF